MFCGNQANDAAAKAGRALAFTRYESRLGVLPHMVMMFGNRMC